MTDTAAENNRCHNASQQRFSQTNGAPESKPIVHCMLWKLAVCCTFVAEGCLGGGAMQRILPAARHAVPAVVYAAGAAASGRGNALIARPVRLAQRRDRATQVLPRLVLQAQLENLRVVDCGA